MPRTSGDVNPYQPPKAEMMVNKPVDFPAPASVKTATIVLGLAFAVLVKLYWDAIKQYGLATVWQDQPLVDPALLTPIGLILALIAKRHKATYCIISLHLALTSYNGLRGVITKWVSSESTEQGMMSDPVSEIVAISLITWLFHRFTFGLPSRRYYGIVREQPPTSETRSNKV